MQARWPDLAPALLWRLASAYGTRVEGVLGGVRRASDLGEPLAEGLYEAELDYLVRREWARSAQDVLWRRTKLGLHLSPAQQERVAHWLQRAA